MTATDPTALSNKKNIVWDPGDAMFFLFEEDFMEDNIRCIPMIVRFKLDACGIKLKLEEWCKFTVEERDMLVHEGCSTDAEIAVYRWRLQQLIIQRTGWNATDLPIEDHPAWANTESIFVLLLSKAQRLGIDISLHQWKCLTNLQRFALIKLSRQSHESKNLPKALKEFGL